MSDVIDDMFFDDMNKLAMPSEMLVNAAKVKLSQTKKKGAEKPDLYADGKGKGKGGKDSSEKNEERKSRGKNKGEKKEPGEDEHRMPDGSIMKNKDHDKTAGVRRFVRTALAKRRKAKVVRDFKKAVTDPAFLASTITGVGLTGAGVAAGHQLAKKSSLDKEAGIRKALSKLLKRKKGLGTRLKEVAWSGAKGAAIPVGAAAATGALGYAAGRRSKKAALEPTEVLDKEAEDYEHYTVRRTFRKRFLFPGMKQTGIVITTRGKRRRVAVPVKKEASMEKEAFRKWVAKKFGKKVVKETFKQKAGKAIRKGGVPLAAGLGVGALGGAAVAGIPGYARGYVRGRQHGWAADKMKKESSMDKEAFIGRAIRALKGKAGKKVEKTLREKAKDMVVSGAKKAVVPAALIGAGGAAGVVAGKRMAEKKAEIDDTFAAELHQVVGIDVPEAAPDFERPNVKIAGQTTDAIDDHFIGWMEEKADEDVVKVAGLRQAALNLIRGGASPAKAEAALRAAKASGEASGVLKGAVGTLGLGAAAYGGKKLYDRSQSKTAAVIENPENLDLLARIRKSAEAKVGDGLMAGTGDV